MRTVEGERGAAIRHAQRAAGQFAAVASMIGSGRSFPAVAQQLLAARGSIDSLLVRLIAIELGKCVPNAQARDEIDGLLRIALRRGAHAPLPLRPRRARSLAEPQPTRVLEGSTLT